MLCTVVVRCAPVQHVDHRPYATRRAEQAGTPRWLAALLGALFAAVAVNVAAQEEGPPLRNERSEPRLYILKVSNPRVYDGPTGGEPKTGLAGLPIGDVYYASATQNGRAKLGKYENEAWIKMLGWVDEDDVLVHRVDSLSVAEALKGGLPVKRSETAGGLSPNNALKVRCVTKPDLKLRTGLFPGDASGGQLLATWSWFFVYAIRQGPNPEKPPDTTTWLLLGRDAQLLAYSATSDTKIETPSKLLVGWVPFSQMSLWCSNLALEYNSDPEAVDNRMKTNRPARVHKERLEASTPLSIENFDAMWTGALPSVRRDPYGLDPAYPRLHIVQAWDQNWIEVASAGSSGPNLAEPQIYDLRLKLSQANRELRQVDLCFVIDATGSMYDEVQQVASFLGVVADALIELQTKGTTKPVAFANMSPLELTSNMNVNVSLITYQDVPAFAGRGLFGRTTYTTKVHFAGLNLVTQRDAINTTIQKDLTRANMHGGVEALHDGMKAGLQTPGVWRDTCIHRLMIVIGDEPGDTNDLAGVINAMPVFSAERIKLIPRLGTLGPLAQKKELTQIFSIFTDPKGDWFQKFRKNVEEASVAVYQVPGMDNPTDRANLSGRISSAVKTKQEAVTQTIDAIADMMKEGLKFEFGALPVLTQLAIEEALARNGLTKADLQKLGEVCFYQGYVLHNPKTALPPFRARVVMTPEEARQLETFSRNTADALLLALDTQKDEMDKLIGQGADIKSRKLLICKVLVLARAQIVGEGKELLNNRELAEKQAQLIHDAVLDRKLENQTVGRMFKIPDSLPLRTDGLLSMPIEKAIALQPNELVTLGQTLRLKARVLSRLLEGFVVPESIFDIDNPQKAPNVTKRWFYSPDNQSTVRYGFIPLAYIP